LVAAMTRTSTLRGARFADPLELTFLQHAQQLALQRQRNFADLVKEQRAAVGQLKPADAVAQRAGEGAFGVTEEFALEQIGRDRRAIDADQRAVAALAVVVDGARHQFLAGAGLAVIRTVASVGATRSTCRSVCWIAALLPMMPW